MNIVIVGATSGIGRALYELYIGEGHTLGIVGRRAGVLEEMCRNHPQRTLGMTADVADCTAGAAAIDALQQRMGNLDLIVVCAGTGNLNPELDFGKELPTLQTNVTGWTALVDAAYRLFERQGHGHLVTVTSVGGLRGEPGAPAYSASKAYQINYTEALRKKAFKSGLPVFVTDIRPGFVDTAMAKGEGLFWVMPPQKVARQIVRAIERRAPVRVVTRRWALLATIIRSLPYGLYKRI